MASTAPVILEVALNGVTSRERNPAAPRLPPEVAEDALRCLAAGATIVHTHTHDALKPPAEAAALYLEAYRPILAARPDAILYPTMGVGRTIGERYDHHEILAAAGAIRAAVDTLMARLHLEPGDLERIILTGSFGGQIDIASAIELGMIPPVDPRRVETIANGAGLGSAMCLSDEGFALGEELAARAGQVDLDQDPLFISRYVGAMALQPEVNNLSIPKT